MPRNLILDYVQGEDLCRYWIQFSPADSSGNTCNIYVYTDKISISGSGGVSPNPRIDAELISALRERLSAIDFDKVMQVILYHLE